MPAGRRSSAAKHGANLAQVRTAIATMKNAPVNAVTTGGSPTRAASVAENAVAPAIRRVSDLVCWHNPHLPEQKLRLAANRHPSVGARLDSGSPGLNGCSGSAFRKMVLSMYGRPRVVNRPAGRGDCAFEQPALAGESAGCFFSPQSNRPHPALRQQCYRAERPWPCETRPMPVSKAEGSLGKIRRAAVSVRPIGRDGDEYERP